ncbi:homeobox protein egl-5-like [Tachyglossus aculeatus]|uniref:homeobox protein egl-5-like n=1 Tax=Tachyglossus aculeatus TaxID=9261 RepID=UPI0018F49453|nr:homeobox protein egl-5-like [Tachyglossus aculeatus]
MGWYWRLPQDDRSEALPFIPAIHEAARDCLARVFLRVPISRQATRFSLHSLVIPAALTFLSEYFPLPSIHPALGRSSSLGRASLAPASQQRPSSPEVALEDLEQIIQELSAKDESYRTFPASVLEYLSGGPYPPNTGKPVQSGRSSSPGPTFPAPALQQIPSSQAEAQEELKQIIEELIAKDESTLPSARPFPEALMPIPPASNAGMDSYPSEEIPETTYTVPTTKFSQGKKSRPDRFSEHQLKELWARFEVTPYLTAEQVKSLSFQLGLTTLQVRNWFRNHRKKYKQWIAPRLQTTERRPSLQPWNTKSGAGRMWVHFHPR